MSSNVGLSTPRGSATSGYVQKSLAQIRRRNDQPPYSKPAEPIKHRQKKPDQDILEHDRKREIELKVFELRDQLEEEGVEEDEVDERCDALRKQLKEEHAGRTRHNDAKGLKQYQTNLLAEADEEKNEKARRALGISAKHEEGDYWRRQEQKKLAAAKRDEPED